LGYTTGQFGKNHLGDRDEYLPTAHGFDEFFGNLYHLNAEEETRAGGLQKIEDTGPLTKKRMETIDEEVTDHAHRLHRQGPQGRQAVLPLV
jgi:arylsulfatase